MWSTQPDGVGDTTSGFGILTMILVAIAVSAVLGALVTLAFVLIRGSGDRLHHR